MSYRHLAPGWESQPLTDPLLLADVLDLVCDLRSRISGSLFALLCDDDLRLLQPVALDELVPRDQFEQAQAIWSIAMMAKQVGAAGIALGICRPGPAEPIAQDRVWQGVLQMACEENGLVAVGCHLVTLDEVVELEPENVALF